MAILTNTFDGGTNNFEMTLGNTGGVSGDAPVAIDPGMLFSNQQVQSGSLSAKTAIGGASSARWGLDATANLAERFYVYRTHNIETTISVIRTSPFSTATHSALSLNSTGNLRISFPAMGAGYYWISPTSIPTNEWIRIEKLTEQGVGATTGRCRIVAFRNDSAISLVDSGWLENLNLLGNEHPMGNWVGLKVSNTTSPSLDLYFDSIELRTGADYDGLFIGPIDGGAPEPLPEPIPPLSFPELPALNETPWFEKRTSWDQFVESKLSTINSAQGGLQLLKVTQSQYDVIPVKDANTLYIIV